MDQQQESDDDETIEFSIELVQSSSQGSLVSAASSLLADEPDQASPQQQEPQDSSRCPGGDIAGGQQGVTSETSGEQQPIGIAPADESGRLCCVTTELIESIEESQGQVPATTQAATYESESPCNNDELQQNDLKEQQTLENEHPQQVPESDSETQLVQEPAGIPSEPDETTTNEADHASELKPMESQEQTQDDEKHMPEPTRIEEPTTQHSLEPTELPATIPIDNTKNLPVEHSLELESVRLENQAEILPLERPEVDKQSELETMKVVADSLAEGLLQLQLQQVPIEGDTTEANIEPQVTMDEMSEPSNEKNTNDYDQQQVDLIANIAEYSDQEPRAQPNDNMTQQVNRCDVDKDEPPGEQPAEEINIVEQLKSVEFESDVIDNGDTQHGELGNSEGSARPTNDETDASGDHQVDRPDEARHEQDEQEEEADLDVVQLCECTVLAQDEVPEICEPAYFVEGDQAQHQQIEEQLQLLQQQQQQQQQQHDCRLHYDDDLEWEFDDEPELEQVEVQVKRGADPHQEYDFGKELGRGRFGTVVRCIHRASGQNLAAKFVQMRREEDRENVEREVAIMCRLQHRRLLQLYAAYDGPLEMCIITELIEGGELFERIVDDDFELTEKKAAIFMRQICEATDYMQKKTIVHLDLKPENILCVSKVGYKIKLIDFGLARELEPGRPLRVMFGTPDFAAPEVLAYETVSLATDMWSVGVICYVLLSGLSPFMGENDMETMANVTRATYDFDSDAFEPISDLAKDFISKLLVRGQSERLRPSECLAHPWLQRGGAQLEASVISRRESIISTISFRSADVQYDLQMAQFTPEILKAYPSLTSLDKRNLKHYVLRRKWHRTVHAIMALGRMGANLKLKVHS